MAVGNHAIKMLESYTDQVNKLDQGVRPRFDELDHYLLRISDRSFFYGNEINSSL